MPRKSELKCYFGCAIDGPLHRFPKWVYPHDERFNSWKAVLDLLTQEKGNEFIYNNIRLCYRHFEDYYQLPSHRLTGNAIPTLNLTTNLQHQLEVQIVYEMPSISQQTPSSSQVKIQTTIKSNVKKQSTHSHYVRIGKDDVVLHSFPNPTKDLNRYQEWTQAVGCDSLEPEYVYKNRRVCHDHFETKYLTWTRRLSPNAVPTLLLASGSGPVEVAQIREGLCPALDFQRLMDRDINKIINGKTKFHYVSDNMKIIALTFKIKA